MGTNSANIARTVINNAFEVVAIELMALIQAVDCLECSSKMSVNTAEIYSSLRKIVPAFKEDSPKYIQISSMKEHIYNNDFTV